MLLYNSTCLNSVVGECKEMKLNRRVQKALAMMGVVAVSVTTVPAVTYAQEGVSKGVQNEVSTEKVGITFKVDEQDEYKGTIEGEAYIEVEIGSRLFDQPLVNVSKGYKLAGWKDEDGNFYTTAQIHEYTFSESETFTAVFEELEVGGNIVKVKFKVDEADAYKGKIEKEEQKYANVELEIGSRLFDQPLVNVSKGYKLAGWRDEAGKFYTTAQIHEYTFYASQTFTAVFEELEIGGNIVKVKFKVNEADAHKGKIENEEQKYANVELEIGSRLFDQPLVNAKEGYKLAGWEDEAGKFYTIDQIYDYTFYASQTFTAVFEEIVQ